MPNTNPSAQMEFYREARIHLPRVAACIGVITQDRKNESALQDLQRYSHQLHQSASAAGLGESLEAAYGAEQLAEAILKGLLPCDDEAIHMFQEALQELRTALLQPDAAPVELPKPAVTAPLPPQPQSELDISTDLLTGFFDEARELLDHAEHHLELVEASQGNRAEILEVRRAVHTVKGSAAMVGLRDVSKLAHALEDTLDELHEGDRTWSPQVQAVLSQALATIGEAVARTAGPTASQPAVHPVPEPPPQQAASPAPPQADPPQQQRPEAPKTSTPAEAAPRKVRVGLDHLDASLCAIGEFSIIRSGWDQQLAAYRRQLDELALAVRRCQRIAQRLDTDYAVYSPGAVTSAHPEGGNASRTEFDALEFDRYTEFHLLTRDLSETASDLTAIEAQLSSIANEFDTTRGRYSKAAAELQENILQMRTAPAAILRERLERTVRAAAQTLGRQVEFAMRGVEIGLDKAILETVAAPLEHILRNAVAHGVEAPADRMAAGKGEQGKVAVEIIRDGANVIFTVADDGAGIDEDAVRQAAVRLGFASAPQAQALSGRALFAFLFEPGFTTAEAVSEIAGRGIGLDIVAAAVESLKGTAVIDSVPGKGTTVTLRFPLSQAILRVLLVEAGGETYALPLSNVLRAGKSVILGSSDRLRQVGLEEALRLPPSADLSGKRRANRPAVVLDCGAEQIVLLVSRILDIREVLVRPPKGVIKKATAVAGTATLADGRVMLVLQPARLARPVRGEGVVAHASPAAKPTALEILIIDDSVSVRRVLTKTLREQGWNVTAAKDGLEALEILNTMHRAPDAILVDIEMPRMDGYDFMVALRSEARFVDLPAIMLTSRGGEKHRRKAADVGVTDFIIKPYEEEELIGAIRCHVAASRQA